MRTRDSPILFDDTLLPRPLTATSHLAERFNPKSSDILHVFLRFNNGDHLMVISWWYFCFFVVVQPVSLYIYEEIIAAFKNLR